MGVAAVYTAWMAEQKILIVDDACMLAEMLALALAREQNLLVVGSAQNAAQALTQAGQTLPDLVLLDIRMPGGSGLDLIEPLRAILPDLKIIMLSGYLDPYTVYRVVQAGVHGYVDKLSPLRLLVEAVHSVLAGQTSFSAGFTAIKALQLTSAEAFHKILSEREQQVLQLMGEGLSDDAIAQQRAISVYTVATHRQRIREKLALHSDRELLAYARRWGLGRSPFTLQN